MEPVSIAIIGYISLKFVDQFIKDEGYGRVKKFFFPAKKYKNRLTQIIYETINEFEQSHPYDTSSQKFPFYHSQILFEELNTYILFNNSTIDYKNIINSFKSNPHIITPTKEHLEIFYKIFSSKVNTDKELKKLFFEENYKSKIFDIVSNLERIESKLNHINSQTTDIHSTLVFNPDNKGLLISMDRGLPVRVIRGYKHRSEFSPKTGYTYAGLYSVVDAWEETGKCVFIICRVRLEYSGQNPERNTPERIELKYSNKPTERKESTVLRIVRDTRIADDVKKLYNYECQVCGETIPTKSGGYAEGAHIKPLGRPHDGDDSSDNLICLCPNHHVMFDKGVFSITDDLKLVGAARGELIVHETHILNKLNLQYHRKSHGYD